MSTQPSLLMINAFIGTAGYKKLYQEVGFAVVAEWSERKAISLVRKAAPAVIVADFYHQTDFRDRLSNLESLLAAVQSAPNTRILVFTRRPTRPCSTRSARASIDAAVYPAGSRRLVASHPAGVAGKKPASL